MSPSSPSTLANEPKPGTVEYAWNRVQGSAYGAEVHLGQLLDWTRTIERGNGVSQHAFHLVGRRLLSQAHMKRGYVTEYVSIRELAGTYSTRHARRVVRELEKAGVVTTLARSGRPGKYKAHPGAIRDLAATGLKTAAAAEAARELAHLQSPASQPGAVRRAPGDLPSWVPLPRPGSSVTRGEIFAAFVEIARILGGDAVSEVPDDQLGGDRRRIYAIWSDRNFCALPAFVAEVRQVTAAYLGGAGGVAWAKLRSGGKLPRSLLTRAYWLANVKIAADWAALQTRRADVDAARAAARDGRSMPDAIDLDGPAAATDVDVDLFHEDVWARYCHGGDLDLTWLCARPRRVEDGRHVLGVDIENWDQVAADVGALGRLAAQVGAIRLEPER